MCKNILHHNKSHNIVVHISILALPHSDEASYDPYLLHWSHWACCLLDCPSSSSHSASSPLRRHTPAATSWRTHRTQHACKTWSRTQFHQDSITVYTSISNSNLPHRLHTPCIMQWQHRALCKYWLLPFHSTSCGDIQQTTFEKANGMCARNKIWGYHQ